MLASICLFAGDVVKHSILGEAVDPSGDIQNVPLSRVVGVSSDCLVVVGHLRIPRCDWFVVSRSLQRVARKNWTVLRLGTPSQNSAGQQWLTPRCCSSTQLNTRPGY